MATYAHSCCYLLFGAAAHGRFAALSQNAQSSLLKSTAGAHGMPTSNRAVLVCGGVAWLRTRRLADSA